MKRSVLTVTLVVLLLLAAVLPASAVAQSTCGQTYTVARGDTLAKIAARCGTSVSALLRANPSITNANQIYVGQRLNIPTGSEQPGGTTYVVQRGDTLAKIAARFGTSVSAILQANPTITNPSRIFPGQRINIPGGSSGGPVFTRVNVTLIALGGGNIGCGDGAVAVTRNIAATRAPLTAAIRELLSIKEQYYGQSGLYNALYQSDLRIQSINLTQGKATIRLSGTLRLGGVCDNPRVKAQLEQTALQFSTVNSVAVFVNDQPLDTLLSGQGQ